jgi:hypothetical protein
LKARKEKAELLERYGELKKELGIEDDMFSKKTDMFGEEKPEAFIKSKDKVKPKVQETVDFDINNVKTIREISMNFINGLDKIYGRSVRTGLVKRFNKKAEGLYFLANKIVRLKSINDIKTLAHEFGHVLDHEIFKYAEKYKLLDIKTRKLFKRELGNLSDYAMKFVKKGGKMHEPIAEFVRLYITEPDFVKKTAPNFYEFFENITKSNENIDGVLKEIRRQYKEYEAQDPRAKIESKIIRDTKEGILNGILPNLKKDKMVDFLIDHTKVFQKLSQQVIEMKDGIDKGKLVYYRMLSLLGVSGKAEAYLKFGEDNVKGFLEIIKEPIIKRQWKEHDGYMVALRNIELFKNGKEEAMTVDYETSLKAKELYEQQFGKEYLEKFQKQVLDYQNMILKKYYESGKLSTENYEKILEDNKYYIPFRRFFDEIETTGTYKLSNVLSDTSPSPVKVIRGSKREIYSPLESVIKNTYDILVSVDRNEVLRTLVENLKIIDTDLVQEIPSTVVKMKKTYDKDIEDYKIVPVFEKDRPVGKEIVSVWEEGVEKYYQIPKEYYDSYFTSQQPLGQFIKIFSIPTRLLQAGAVVYEPGFGFSNPFRDQTTAYMTSRYGYKPWLDFVKGMTHRLKKDAIYEKFMKSGAGMNFLTAIDEMMTKRYMEKKLGKHAEDYTKYAKRYLRNPLTALRDFNEMTESGTRIGAFERAYKKTGDVWLAMEEARQISGDYGVKGRGMRNVAPLFSFLNAKIQHAKLFFEVGEGERGSISSKMLKGMVGITLPAMLNWLYINTDDELRAEYDDLPEWRKYTCFNIPIPFTKTFMPIPKGSYGTLFGTTVEKLLDFAKHEDKYFVKDLLKYLFQEVSPISSTYEFIPTFARPIIEQIANTKSFQGTPIVPERLKDVQSKEQYTDFTPMVYRGLGKVLGLSPLRIETFVNGYLAGTGRNISGVMDEVGEKAGIFKDNDVSKFNILGFDLTKLPFTRRVLSDRYRGLRGEQLNIFYDELSKLESIHKTFKSYMDKEEYDKGKEYIEKNKDEYDFYIKNQTNLNKFKKFLVIARDIAFTEKDKADEINDIVFEVAKDFKKKMREGISFELNDKIIEILSKKKRTDKEQKEYEEEILNEFGIEKKKSKKSSGFDVENSGFK